MAKELEKVILLVGGFPTKENLARCIFNYRAAQLISDQGIDIEVVFIRAWIPRRPLISTTRESGFNVTTLCIPIIPGFSIICLQLFLHFYPYYLGRLVKHASIIHSVGADTIGVFGSMISKKYNLKHVTQLIGSDVNSILPKTKDNLFIKGWENNIHGISANSRAILINFYALYPEIKVKSIVNYRGVSLNNFKPSYKNKESFTILFLGGLPDYPDLPHKSNTKGGESLMRIWSKIDQYVKVSMLPVLIFGGPGSDKQEVLNWREKLQSKNNVKILGNIKPVEVRKCMDNVSLVIIPSKEEGVPNVGFESLAMGLPILGSNVGGIPELIDNNVNGWILEPEEEFLWVEKLKEIIEEPSVLIKMGKMSRQIAEQKFSDKLFGERIKHLYKEVLQ